MKYAAILVAVGLIFPPVQIAEEEQRNHLPLAGPRVVPVKEYIALHAGADARKISRIVNCESRFDPEAKNPTSTATGLAQFLEGTWVETRTKMKRDPDLELRKDPYESVDTLIFLHNKGRGESHWKSSKHCWK